MKHKLELPKQIAFEDLQPDDLIRITGRCLSCATQADRQVSVQKRTSLRIVGTVASIDKKERILKLWPEKAEDDPDKCGKMFFHEKDISWMTLLNGWDDE
jgi:hypothetical protein